MVVAVSWPWSSFSSMNDYSWFGWYSRMTSTLYVALISPARLETLQVYLPLCSGTTFFRLRVHFLWRPSPTSCSVRGRSSFSHTMSGRGFPLAEHLRRTVLPTGHAITLRLIFSGCVKRGRAARGKYLVWICKDWEEIIGWAFIRFFRIYCKYVY